MIKQQDEIISGDVKYPIKSTRYIKTFQTRFGQLMVRFVIKFYRVRSLITNIRETVSIAKRSRQSAVVVSSSFTERTGKKYHIAALHKKKQPVLLSRKFKINNQVLASRCLGIA